MRIIKSIYSKGEKKMSNIGETKNEVIKNLMEIMLEVGKLKGRNEELKRQLSECEKKNEK